MSERDPFHVWDLCRTVEVDASFGTESERLRVELWRSRKTATRFRPRILRTALIQAGVDFSESDDDVELSPVVVLEDVTVLLGEQDTDFEVGDVDAAEARVLAALHRRSLEAAWIKT